MINESVSSAGLLVRSFTIYKFLTLLAAPFTSMDAFQKGFIDNRGNFKQNLDLLLRANKIDPLEVIIIKLKKFLGTVPNPGLRSSLNNQLAILDLFLSEMYKYDVQPHEALYLLETHCLKEGFSILDFLVEDMTVGSGDVAGLLITDIVGPKQKELKDPYREKKKLFKRKPLEDEIEE
jgi:hypothetical protein